MVVDEIKEKIDDLTAEEMREVSVYLTKKQIENDPELWESIRENADDRESSSWVDIKELK